MSSLIVSLEVLSPGDLEIVKLCDEATHVDIRTWGDPQSPKRPFSTLCGLVFNGQRYPEKVASCACAAMRVFKFGEQAYTVCAEHGLQAIGDLRREIPMRSNGR